MDNLCQLLWLTLLCFKITFVWGVLWQQMIQLTISSQTCNHSMFGRYWNATKKKFDRATYHPHDFLCGKHKRENRWWHNNKQGFCTRAPWTIYSSTATNLNSVYRTLCFGRVGKGQLYDRICISWSKRLPCQRIEMLTCVLETHYHAHMTR